MIRSPRTRLDALAFVMAALVSASCSKPNDPASPPPLAGSTSSPAPAPPEHHGLLRPGDLFDAPASYLGRTVEVAIVEPLSGPETPEALAKAEYGQVRVDMPDNRGSELALVPASFKADDPGRYRTKFDRVISGPVLARGVFERDEEMTKSNRHPVYVLRVASITPLPLEAPVRASGVADLEARRAYWDRRPIIYEGVLTQGFEVSSLDGVIWFAPTRGMTESGTPPSRERGQTKERVRVTGILFARANEGYGHLGAARFELQASRVEHLGAP
jgi:hypothetical protein